MREISVTEYLDTKYLEYAKDVVENRAIPSVIDGFKPVQRKAITAAIQNAKSKYYKIFQLTGIVASTMNYAHGDASLNESIINMARDFKNSLPYFDRDGQFGSLRNPEAGAPRYIGVKLNDTFSKLFRDTDLVDYLHEEGQRIEPFLYYPIIPTVLLNGQKGIAVGHGSDIFNRNPLDLVNSIISLVKSNRWKEPGLYLKGFNGDIESVEGSWFYKGRYEIINTSTLKITEIPPSKSYEDYEAHLIKLQDKDIIKSYEDNSAEFPEYTISIARTKLKELQDKNNIEKVFGLVEQKTENLTVLLKDKEIQRFENVKDLCEYFIDFRMGIYTKRKSVKLDSLERELALKSNISRFIMMYIKDELKIAKRATSAIEADLEKNKFDKIDGSFDYLLKLSLKRLTKEELLSLKDDINNIKDEIKLLKSKTEQDLYLEDLTELKKDIVKLMK